MTGSAITYTTGTHTVQSGDNLSKIAGSYGVSLTNLLSANPQITNPNLIYPGQILNLPGGGTTTNPPIDPNVGGGSPNSGGGPPGWKPTVPTTWDASTEYTMFANAVLPYLSPEDQRSVASNLSRNDPTQFGGMNPTSTLYPTPPTQLSTETKRYYQSADRAKTILTNLDTAAKQSGQAKFGAGYAWLQQVASVMRDYGAKGGDGQTRTQQLQMLSALDPLMAEGKSETLSAYAPIAQALAQPFFSAGAVIPVQKSSTGQWIFGSYNAGLER